MKNPISVLSLKSQMIRGSVWLVSGHGLSQAIRFGSNLVLTRLLQPELFGLMALVNIFLTGLMLFSDIGIRPSIVQNERGDDPVFLNTAWTIQVIRGCLLWLVCILIAGYVSDFYEEPRLAWLLPIVGLNTLILGFSSTNLARLHRHLELGRQTRFELGAQVVNVVVMILWAFFNPTIWALVAGSISAAIYQAVRSHSLLPGKLNRFVLEKESVKAILAFGKWIFIATAMTFLAKQADRLVLGKLLSFEMLGVYSIAFALSDLPRVIIQKFSIRVIFPLVSRQADQPRSRLREKILSKRGPILLGLAVALAVLAGFGDLLILVLYDDRYSQAAWMFPILAVGVWPTVLHETISRSLNAIGRPQYLAYAYFVRFVFAVVCLQIGFAWLGIVGAIIAVALSDLPVYLISLFGLYRERIGCFWQDFQATVLFVLVIAAIAFSRHIAGIELPIEGIIKFI